MPHYAIYQGPDVVGVQEAASADGLPTGAVELQNWAGWTPRPSPHHSLRFFQGTLKWEDRRDATQAWVDVRASRDRLMKDTDWMVTRSVERGANLSAAWRSYRQALRDITDQPDPFNISWPEPPSA
jgi:hypothetical protein